MHGEFGSYPLSRAGFSDRDRIAQGGAGQIPLRPYATEGSDMPGDSGDFRERELVWSLLKDIAVWVLGSRGRVPAVTLAVLAVLDLGRSIYAHVGD
jgi:hypothetical protein